MMCDYLVQQIDSFVYTKKMSFWGGLQFDKDIRKLCSYFTSICSISLRDKFSQLLQVSSLLQLEDMDEIKHYTASSIWKLTKEQTIKILSLRIDFKATEIKELL